MNTKINIKNICIGSGLLLLLAIPSFLPYGYYTFLRWAIFLISIYVSYKFYKLKLNSWVFVFGGLAFLFNPILPVYLKKESWIPIDFVSSILFFTAAYYKRNSKQK